MKTVFNILSTDVIAQAHAELDAFKKETRWASSQNFWMDCLHTGTIIGSVTQTFASPSLTSLVHNAIRNYIPKCNNIVVQHYLWHPLSGINMHGDAGYTFGATIYLTPVWDINWGGLFVYETSNGLKATPPTFNSININTEQTPHMVTTVSPLAPYPRHTLQIWGE